MSKEQKVPKFMTEKDSVGQSFEIYQKGGYVRNPFTGEGIELNALELSVYDALMGLNMLATAMDRKFNATLNHEDLNPDAQVYWKKVRDGLDWFRKNNAKAYMVLLD